jgi:hypothetical protein
MVVSCRRAERAAFWTIGTLALSATLVAAAALAGAPQPWLWGGAAVVAPMPGLWIRGWFDAGVWVWNGVARRIASWLQTYVLVVCYFTLFAGVGRTASALAMAPPHGIVSRWRRRVAAARRSDDPQGLFACARLPGAGWTLVLFPIVSLLAVLQDGTAASESPSGSSYTLY